MCYQRHQDNAPFPNNGGLLITSGCQVRRHSKRKRAKEGAPTAKQLMDFVNRSLGSGGTGPCCSTSAYSSSGCGQLDHSSVPDGKPNTIYILKVRFLGASWTVLFEESLSYYNMPQITARSKSLLESWVSTFVPN